jgi:hypothetical protein
MAKFSLTPYETTKAPKVIIESEFNLTEESIFISFKVTGSLSHLDLGPGHPNHARVMKLWEKTCFELFVKNAKNSYMEFNFSPEFEWNTFYFEKKGDPLLEYARMDSIKKDILLSLDVFQLIVEIDKKKFPDAFFNGPLEIGISSVVKEKDKGTLSYWALAHHDVKPNFHDFRSFVLV